MHDLDRTQNLFEADSYETGFNFEEEGEFEGDFEGDFESDFGYETDSPFNEVEEMELAAQLLEITDEAELDQFLGSLIKKAGKAVGKFAKSGIGRAIGGLLKGAALNALPMVGNLIAPGIGGAIGSQLSSSIGEVYGMELEGLSPQDQEFEVARRFVRFAGSAAKKAVQAPSSVPPRHAAKKAVVTAARKHAPGLLKAGVKPGRGRGHCHCPQAQGAQQYSAGAPGVGAYGAGGQYPPAGAQYPSAQPSGAGEGPQSGASGRWIRQNGQIILLGA